MMLQKGNYYIYTNFKYFLNLFIYFKISDMFFLLIHTIMAFYWSILNCILGFSSNYTSKTIQEVTFVMFDSDVTLLLNKTWAKLVEYVNI